MDDVQPEVTPEVTPEAAPEPTPAPSEAAPVETRAEGALMAAAAVPEVVKIEAPKREGRPQGPRPQGQKREDRPPRPDNRPDNRGGEKREGRGGPPGDRPQGDRPHGDRNREDRRPGGDRGDRREGRPGGGRPFEMAPEIDIEKLISDSLYLDNQAHAVVARMRDMDSGTKSQLRRLYNAVRRAVRAPDSEKQHQFVMLRARLAYTIARHSLRSLDALERLLLQVTRRNDARGYERFKDLFEAIVAYNE
jgi:CRISPR type III-A-associated protein Csm2